jgi:hypothetical protein
MHKFNMSFVYSWIDILDLNQPFSWIAEIWEPFKMKLIWGLQSWTLLPLPKAPGCTWTLSNGCASPQADVAPLPSPSRWVDLQAATRAVSWQPCWHAPYNYNFRRGQIKRLRIIFVPFCDAYSCKNGLKRLQVIKRYFPVHAFWRLEVCEPTNSARWDLLCQWHESLLRNVTINFKLKSLSEGNLRTASGPDLDTKTLICITNFQAILQLQLPTFRPELPYQKRTCH